MDDSKDRHPGNPPLADHTQPGSPFSSPGPIAPELIAEERARYRP